MLDFKVLYNADGKEMAQSFDSVALGDDTPAEGVSLNSMKVAPDWIKKEGWTVGKMAAWCKKFNADIEYSLWGIEDRFDIIRAKVLLDGPDSSILSLLNYNANAYTLYLGKFDSAEDFACDYLTKMGKEWMIPMLDIDVVAEAFSKDFPNVNGHWFKSRH